MGGDHPCGAFAGDEPGGQRTEFGVHVHVGVVDAERVPWVADVHLGRQPDPSAGGELAVGDPLQPAHDAVGWVRGVLDDGADDGVAGAAGEAVGAGAQRGERAGQGDLAGRGRVDGQRRLVGQRTVGDRFQRSAGGVPSGRHRGHADTQQGGGGRDRRCSQAHPSQCGRGGGARPAGVPGRVTSRAWRGAYRAGPGACQAGSGACQAWPGVPGVPAGARGVPGGLSPSGRSRSASRRRAASRPAGSGRGRGRGRRPR